VACRELDWRVLRNVGNDSAGFLGERTTLIGLTELGLDFEDILTLVETGSGDLSGEEDDEDEDDDDSDEDGELDELSLLHFLRLLRLALR